MIRSHPFYVFTDVFPNISQKPCLVAQLSLRQEPRQGRCVSCLFLSDKNMIAQREQRNKSIARKKGRCMKKEGGRIFSRKSKAFCRAA